MSQHYGAGTNLRQLPDVSDSPAFRHKAVRNWSHEGRHGSHCQVGDEREQRRGLHIEAQGQLKVGW